MNWMDEEVVKTLKKLQSESINGDDDFAYCVAIAAVERMSDIEAFNKELREENQKLSDKISNFNKISVKNAQVVSRIVQENTALKRQAETDYKAQYEQFSKKAEIVISQLRADRDRLLEAFNKIKAEIIEEKESAYADFEQYKVEYLGQEWEDVLNSLPQDDYRFGMERCIDIINKYSEE